MVPAVGLDMLGVKANLLERDRVRLGCCEESAFLVEQRVCMVEVGV